MIFVTGGTGLVGSHLLFELTSEGHKVLAAKRPQSNVADLKRIFSYYTSTPEKLLQLIEWKEIDLLDVYSVLEAMEGVSEVYHCAAMVSFNPKDEEQIMQVNVQGTANLVNAALEKKVSKFCHVSSIATIGKPENADLYDESMFWKNSPENSKYSISKYGAEREVWRASEEGLNVVIVNPSLIVGPGNWTQSSSNMFTKAYKGIRFYTDGKNGFVDVRDVARLMIRLMENNVFSERFLISSENKTYKYFFDLIHDEFNKSRPSIKAGKFLSGFAWRVEKLRFLISGSNPLITKETARSAHKISNYSNSKILKQFPDHSFISLEQSVKDTCKAFLKDKN